jgi:hypothetical protein
MKSDPPHQSIPHGSSKEEVQYRLYFLDDGGHITRSHEFLAKDDGAAVEISAAWREGRRMELWQADRLVQVWEQS